MQINIPERVITRAIQQQYFNKSEAASYLGKSLTTFKKWREDYGIPFYSIDGQVTFNKKDLDDFMEKYKHK